MTIERVPYCFHPTTVIFIDDDSRFLKSFSLQISANTPCLTYQNPFEALDYLKKNRSASFIDRCTVQSLGADSEEMEIRVDLRKVHLEAFDANRFGQVTIALVDYSMPGMNGVEFCRQLKSSDIKKIMLTGEADYNIAVQAFNEGIIDKFIMKGTTDLIDVVNEAIYDMQLQYFIHQSDLLSKNFSAELSVPACLKDAEFSAFFYQLIKQKQVVEFYILDQKGNFLLLDVRGKPSWLVIRDEKTMESLYRFALSEHEQEPVEDSDVIVEAIKNRKSIPFFYPEQDYDMPVYDWRPYLHEAQLFDGKNQKYYYSYIQGKSVYPLNVDKIKPLSQHTG